MSRLSRLIELLCTFFLSDASLLFSKDRSDSLDVDVLILRGDIDSLGKVFELFLFAFTVCSRALSCNTVVTHIKVLLTALIFLELYFRVTIRDALVLPRTSVLL